MVENAAPPTVLLISYHFYPSNEIGGRRATSLARFLASKGVRVLVVSTFGGTTIAPESELSQGIVAIPIKQPRKLLIDAIVSLKHSAGYAEQGVAFETIPPAGVRALLLRLRCGVRETFFQVVYFVDEHKKWGWRAAKAAVRAGRRHHARLILSSSPPFTAMLTGWWIASRLGIPHIVDLRDPWTDSLTGRRPLQRLQLRLLRVLEGWALRSAAAITSTSASVAELLSKRYRVGHKIHVVRNGYEGEFQRAPAATGGRLAILFAGELYAGRDPFPLLTALENMLARPDVDPGRISMTFMGNAAHYKGVSLAEWLDGRRCGSVIRILPQVPQQAVAGAVAEATVLLNLAQEQPLSVPAKTYEHLASGREVLLICENDSETASLVAGMTGVNQVDQRDARALEDVLLDLYRRHALQGLMTCPIEAEVRSFSRVAANETFWPVLGSVADLRDRTQSDVGASSSPAP